MNKLKNKVEKKLSLASIVIPPNPFWDVFKRFGRDESIALIINVLGTAIVSFFVNSNIINTIIGPISRRVKDVIISTSGPVVEKAGFFPAHIKDAWTEYRKAPNNKRDPFTTYFKRAFKSGAKSLIEDILIHDPLYIFLMFFGLKLYSNVPAWMLAALSFIIAILLVAVIEVTIIELAYLRYKVALRKAGFGIERYYESRFYISSKLKPKEIIERLSKEFNLPLKGEIKYSDRYYESDLPIYSGRIPKVRLRERNSEDKIGTVKTLQIIYTKSSEAREKIDQYRYFPIKKEKMYFIFDNKMPSSIEDIQDERIRRIAKRAVKNGIKKKISFTRLFARNKKTILASVDKVRSDINKNEHFYLLELKVRKDVSLLKATMKFVMREFPVVQTTHGKSELITS